jgi:O-methyltransferase domain
MNIFEHKITTENELLLLGNMYVVSRALHTVAEQKIADLFEDNLPKSIDILAKQYSMSPMVLKKLLRVLCPFGIFKENADGTFSLEKVGEVLKSSHPSGMRDLLFCEDCRWNSFGQMSQSLTTGETGFSKLYKQEYFDYIAQHPHLRAGFDNHMKVVSAKEDPIIAESLPLTQKKKVIDVGGGKGVLLRAILMKHPHILGGMFELPEVAKQEIDKLAQKFQGRIEIFSGSFFEALPFKSDGIVLKRVLHDWDDAHCVQILSHCREALEDESSEIYVVESLIKGQEDSSLLRIFDLLLLMVFGGIERSIEEYSSIFSQSGLKLKHVISTDSGMSILIANMQ